jgi:hypothetical protein
MDVKEVSPSRPKTVIGDARERGDDGVRQSEPEQAQLAAMRVPGQDEIGRPFRQMAKRARVVEKPDPEGFTPRMASADFFDVSLSFSSTEIEAEDLDGPRVGLDAAHFVDQQRNACGCQARAHVHRCFVIVVAKAREAAPRKPGQRSQGLAEKSVIALRLHRQKVSGQKHEVRTGRDGALTDATEPPDRHERAQMRVGDLHDSERPRVSTAGAGRTPEARPTRTSDRDVDRPSSWEERIDESEESDRIRHEETNRTKTHGRCDGPREREERAREKPRRRPTQEQVVKERRILRRARKTKLA